MSTPPVVQAVLPCKLMSLRTCAGICAQPVHTHSCQTRHAAICSGAHGLSCSFKTVCMLQVLEPFLVWACCVSSAGTELMVISCGVHLHLGVSSCITFCRQHRLAPQSANCLHRPSPHSANYLHVLVSVSALCFKLPFNLQLQTHTRDPLANWPTCCQCAQMFHALPLHNVSLSPGAGCCQCRLHAYRSHLRDDRHPANRSRLWLLQRPCTNV